MVGWKGYEGAISPGVVDAGAPDEEHMPRGPRDAAMLILEDECRPYADPLTAEELEAGLVYIRDAYPDADVAALRRKILAE